MNGQDWRTQSRLVVTQNGTLSKLAYKKWTNTTLFATCQLVQYGNVHSMPVYDEPPHTTSNHKCFMLCPASWQLRLWETQKNALFVNFCTFALRIDHAGFSRWSGPVESALLTVWWHQCTKQRHQLFCLCGPYSVKQYYTHRWTIFIIYVFNTVCLFFSRPSYFQYLIYFNQNILSKQWICLLSKIFISFELAFNLGLLIWPRLDL